MRVPGRRAARRAAAWAVARLGGGAVILGYHRVAEETEEDPWEIRISPARFAEHLEAIRSLARPVSLDQVGESLEAGRPLRGAVAVTIDDGYADALYEARPLLERHGVPATVFLVSGALGGEFWWDTLERIVRAGLPERFALRGAGGPFEWPRTRARPWRREAGARAEGGTPALREALFRHLRALPGRQRGETLERLAALAGDRGGGGGAGEPRLRRPLRPEEVLRLVDGELVRAGAHTATHPALDALPAAEVRAEVRGGRGALAELLGGPPSAFAYPHGAVSGVAASEVRAAGFRLACASQQGVAGRWADRFRLPRLWPGSDTGDALAARLRRWLRG